MNYQDAHGDWRHRRWMGRTVFDKPSVIGTKFDWIATCMVSLILQGNAWGFITGRDGYGYPTGIEWIPPEDVYVEEDPQQRWNPMRAQVYVYGRKVDWMNELFHVKAFPLPGRIEGISPLRAFAETILAGKEAMKYGTTWFQSGGFPPGTFKNNEIEIDGQQAQEMRDHLLKTLRQRVPLVYGRDWDYKPVTVNANEAQFIEALQLNATHIAAILNLPPDRLGGTRGDSLTYNCVDAQTEILTQRGWLTHSQVREGDLALTANTMTGLSEWQPVQRVHTWDDGPYPVQRFESRNHSSASTLNHRWPVTVSRRSGWDWKLTSGLSSEHRVAAALPVTAPSEAKWSDALVELIAWFWTEGWQSKYGSVTLAQSDHANPQNVARIRHALTTVFGPSGSLYERGVPSWREDHGDRGIVHFRLNARAGRQLIAHAPGKVISVEFLSQLTRAQLELFYQVSIDADGTRRRGTGDVIAQKDKARLDAFQVACALTGRAGTVCGPNSRGMYHMSIRKSPWVKPNGHAKFTAYGTEPLVWCVQTENKSWFARRNGTCYFTGNTTEQSTLQVIEALRPWLVRLEEAFFDCLPQNRFARFYTDALLKTDLKTRMDIYVAQRNIGMRTVDELRELEDLPPMRHGVGKEEMPLVLMQEMAARAGVIPRSILSSVVFEMDLAADRLEEISKKYPQAEGEGNAGPVVQSPVQYLGGLITQQNRGGEAGREAEVRLKRIADRARALEKQPEYIGAWIPESHASAPWVNGKKTRDIVLDHVG